MKKRLEEAEALANKLHAEMYGDGTPALPEVVIVPTTEEPPETSPEIPPVEPEEVIPPEEPLVETVVVPPVEPSKPEKPPEKVPDDWEHKYKVLQGMYNKLNDDFKTSAKDIDTLNNVLASFREGVPAEPYPTTSLAPASMTSEAVNALRAEYPSIFDGITAYVENELNKFKQTTIAPTTSRLENMEATSIRNKKDGFYKALEDVVPDWVIVNNDPEFMQGLQEREPYSGATKHQLLMNAYDTFDAGRVAKFFNDFKASKTSVVTLETEPIDDLEGKVHPTTSHGKPVPPSGPAKGVEIISGSYITKFYNELSQGKYRGKAKLADEIRLKIDKAVMERRVDSTK